LIQRNTIRKFFTAESWSMFFLRFAIFSLLAMMFWSIINIPYGKFVCEKTLAYERYRSLPILDVKYSDLHGLTMTILLAPSLKAPAPLIKPKNVELNIFPNTLHFNIIPFLALLLATPFRTGKRLVLFLFFGFIFLSISHFIHLHLDIIAYYFSQQTFATDTARMAPERLQEAQTYIYYMRFIAKLQGFMEQAGSMVIPAFIWMIYAQKWLFSSLLESTRQQQRRKNALQKKAQEKNQQD